ADRRGDREEWHRTAGTPRARRRSSAASVAWRRTPARARSPRRFAARRRGRSPDLQRRVWQLAEDLGSVQRLDTGRRELEGSPLVQADDVPHDEAALRDVVVVGTEAREAPLDEGGLELRQVIPVRSLPGGKPGGEMRGAGGDRVVHHDPAHIAL